MDRCGWQIQLTITKQFLFFLNYHRLQPMGKGGISRKKCRATDEIQKYQFERLRIKLAMTEGGRSDNKKTCLLSYTLYHSTCIESKTRT